MSNNMKNNRVNMLQLPAAPEGYELRIAAGVEDMRSFARLAQSYHTWLDVDLCFQDFDKEMANLPGCYAEPNGVIVLASSAAEHKDIACVAVRPLLPHHQVHSSFGCLHDAPEVAAATSSGKDQPLLDTATTCEMKRLWVDAAHHKSGLGRVLVAAAVECAKQMNYRHMVLDTLEKLTAANRLYEKAGFARRHRYNHNPLPGVVYWEKEL